MKNKKDISMEHYIKNELSQLKPFKITRQRIYLVSKSNKAFSMSVDKKTKYSKAE